MTAKRKRIIDDDSDSDSGTENATPQASTPPPPANKKLKSMLTAEVKKEDGIASSSSTSPSSSSSSAASASSTPIKADGVKKEEEDDEPMIAQTPVRSRKDTKRSNRRATRTLKEDDSESDDEVVVKRMKAKAAVAPPAKKIVEDDDSDEEHGSDDESDDGGSSDDNDSDFEFDDKKKKTTKKNGKSSSSKKPTKKAPAKKKVLKEESEDDDDEEMEEKISTPKKKATKTTKATKATKKEEGDDSATTKKGKKVKKEEEEVFKWWLEDNVEELLTSDIKWRTLKHNGVVFPPPYQPHGIPVTYEGKDVVLTPEQEELATMYALMRETEYYNKPLFQKNFWSVWKEILGKKHVIKDLKRCNFTKIWEYHLQEKEKKLAKSKEEKAQEKEEKDKIDEPYRWCFIDGKKEKVGNFKIEPPGLFRGRGEHPKQGFLKKRVVPEDVTINIGNVKDAPRPPKGHKWKEVVSNNKATWLASWKEPLTGNVKYVGLASSSSFKGISDFLKYQTARDLKKQISKIRKVYKKNWTSEDTKTQQLGVAMYFIDKLALRVGNEKDDEEEADTVGCCSLRCEHINLKENNNVEFDFLGKDSIRYQNTVEVDAAVYKCLKQFKKGKKKDANLFDLINSSILNKELKQFMPKLTAKVFRTFNASLTLDKCLREMDDEIAELDVTDKLAAYNKANREVAILCNHQKTVSKTHGNSMLTMDKKIEEHQDYIARLKEALKLLKKKDFEEVKVKWDLVNEQIQEQYEKDLKEFEKKQTALEKEAKKKGVSVAVLTGTTKRDKPPKKPAKKVLPKNEDAIKKMIEKVKEKIKVCNSQKQQKEENKTVALGTSRINYCDPRITVAWCKRNDVPVSKLFAKTLMNKFPWAMDAEPDYQF